MVEKDTKGHAVVMGLGRFGGGSGAAAYLLAQGMDVIVTDLAPPERLQGAMRELQALPGANRLRFCLGEHNEADFTNAQLVIANPAVPHPWSNRFLQAAHAANVTIKTEIELVLERIDHTKLIGVTGTAGKSTTCAMIDHIVRAHGKTSILGGNIGGSLLERPDHELDSADAIVLELSSFMLHWIKEGGRPFNPAVAVLTSLDTNHIDWHETLEHYVTSKQFLHDSAANGRFVGPLYPDDIAPTLRVDNDAPWWHTEASDPWADPTEQQQLLKTLELSIPGDHQKRNAIAALRATAMLLEPDLGQRCTVARELAPYLTSFAGLPHRLRPVGTIGGVLIVDDSKSTTPAAAQRAVASFEDPTRIHIVAGGFDKGSDLSDLAALGDQVGGLYAIGQTGPTISTGRNAHHCGTMDEAVRLASTLINTDDILLLSPGCASWDQFDNYQQRGDAFLAAAEKYLTT